MDVSNIMTFLKSLGCQRVSAGEKWVRSTCPAEYRHKNGKDTVPSFAVSIHPGDTSFCRCQACGISGGLDSLLWRLVAEGRKSRPQLFNFLIEHNQMSLSRLESMDIEVPSASAPSNNFAGRVRSAMAYTPLARRVSNFVNPAEEPQAEVPEIVVQQMIADMPQYVLEYLQQPPNFVLGGGGRNLTRMTIAEWELGWHPLQQRICIPIRDENGKLVAVSGRSYSDDDSKGPKYLHSRFKRDRVLFGENRHDSKIRKGYLFEGFFQTIYSWQCGYVNVLARMGTHLSYEQAIKLVRWFDHLVLVPDGDKAGKEAVERDARNLADWVVEEEGKSYKISQIEIAKMPKGRDADTLPPMDLQLSLGPINKP